MELEKKKLLITHVDLDGMGVVILQQYFDLKYHKILSLDYDVLESDTLYDFIKIYDDITFVDTSPKVEVYHKCIQENKVIRIYDHHEASLYFKNFPNCYIDIERCGTRIFFEDYVLPLVKRCKSIVFDLVKYIDIYDRWQNTHPLWDEAVNFQRVLFGSTNWNVKEEYSYKKFNIFISRQILKLQRKNKFFWIQAEKNIIERSKAKELSEYKYMMNHLITRQDKKGYKFGLTSSASKISLNCNKFLLKHTDYDYILVINEFNGLNEKIHARSTNPNINLNDLCKCLKGHPHAAGGYFKNMDDVNKFIDGEIHDLIDYEGKLDE